METPTSPRRSKTSDSIMFNPVPFFSTTTSTQTQKQLFQSDHRVTVVHAVGWNISLTFE